jgi:hypothetical protein
VTVAMQWFGKHASITETVFSAWSVPKVYKRHGSSLADSSSEVPREEWCGHKT